MALISARWCLHLCRTVGRTRDTIWLLLRGRPPSLPRLPACTRHPSTPDHRESRQAPQTERNVSQQLWELVRPLQLLLQISAQTAVATASQPRAAQLRQLPTQQQPARYSTQRSRSCAVVSSPSASQPAASRQTAALQRRGPGCAGQPPGHAGRAEHLLYTQHRSCYLRLLQGQGQCEGRPQPHAHGVPAPGDALQSTCESFCPRLMLLITPCRTCTSR